jgi:biopolymer transport protein ExbB/TolQ
MFYYIHAGGPFMWLLLLLAIVILVLTVKKIIQLFIGNKRADAVTDSGINSILFWGGISVMLGFFAHFLGVYISMQVISRAHEISSAVVAEGYAISLIPILFGMIIFIFSAIVWYILRWNLKRVSVSNK